MRVALAAQSNSTCSCPSDVDLLLQRRSGGVARHLRELHMRSFGRGVLMIISAALCACASPYSSPVVDPNDVPFLGIEDGLRDGRGPPDILTVHGMCTHQVSDLRSADAALARALEMQPADADNVQLRRV